MGLDVSHDAWQGAYSAFNRWRKSLAYAAGGTWVEGDLMSGRAHFTYRTEALDDDPDLIEGFMELMQHSDCDGEIAPEMCGKVADALERLLPHIDEREAGGHMPSVHDKTLKFIQGCRIAHAAGQPLEFG